MNYQDRWLLPAGITEILPYDAAKLEQHRRQILDFFKTWGYELVIPPMIEYVESLLVDTGRNLDLQTFKLTDQLTGRMMGVRADMTPQVARIDAHHLKRDTPSRLCYLGAVLHTRPNSFAGSRAPIQVGAELYGYEDVASDAEILSLMLETLRLVDIHDFHVDVGHVQIYQSLREAANLDQDQQNQLTKAVKRKAQAEIKQLLTEWNVDADLQTMLVELVELNGDQSVLEEARKVLAKAPQAVHTALDDLNRLREQLPEETLHFDLAEARGYSYHTGIVFAAYVAKHGDAIAKGGRYDNLGKAFGKDRPATGFSTNLATLASLASFEEPFINKYFAPASQDPALKREIKILRSAGEIVMTELPNQQGDAKALGCTHTFQLIDGQWSIVPL
ncbi:ATP phosphoribosyltransferase regulatory subunit [Candidatus Albibeggiatoa sp. nov. NOAA]|uniref:ATP phosphoribosyltransferase regulatory subunit n=1 Tax=Candidatus Albibeggiatoa sp. nov. NOAA TaxID=3162724 RepID=UPI0032F163E8|nr:ATP phosphoribosyltransferase regulatory subunit [Thiotrichaceae bacterium]